MFPDFCSVSFNRGFHSPANRARLDELLVDNVLTKKGRLSKADRDREQGETFAAMRRQHPAVESAINNLEHRGLDRVRSKGRRGFARSVALAVVALNVHRLGRVLRQQARNNIVSQPEAGKNEQLFPTHQLREPKGIPNDDQTEQKSLIGRIGSRSQRQQNENRVNMCSALTVTKSGIPGKSETGRGFLADTN